jgi:TonB family protein
MTLVLEEREESAQMGLAEPGGAAPGQGTLAESAGSHHVIDARWDASDPLLFLDEVPRDAGELPILLTPSAVPNLDPHLPGMVGGRGVGPGGGHGKGSGYGKGNGSGRFREVPGANPGLNLKDLEVIHEEIPNYPPAAYWARMQGDVVVRITINETGSPIQTILISGHPAFHAETLRAAKLWRFGSGVFQGRKVDVTFDMIFRYRFSYWAVDNLQ